MTRRDDKDLIYEGIATRMSNYFDFPVGARRQRPDLRRDCDLWPSSILPTVPRRQRPDLRRDCDARWWLILIWYIDDKDLIYEGIATFLIRDEMIETGFSRTTKT